MFIESKTFIVKEGFSDKMIEKFSKSEKIKAVEGFVELSVIKRVRKGDNEEVVVMIRWENQKAFTNWKNSDAHKAGHSEKKERPEYIIDVKMDTYTVEVLNTK